MITPFQTKVLKARYESGETIPELASKEHTASMIYCALLAAGVKFRAKGRRPGLVTISPRIQRMIDFRNSGKSLAEVARRFRISPQAVWRQIQYHTKGKE